MKFKILILLVAMVIVFNQKIQAQNLDGKWIVTQGWFGADTISLEKLDVKKHTVLSTLLIFADKDCLLQEIHNPEKLGFCGFGRLYFDTAIWKLNKKIINFNIKGGYIAEKTFAYEGNYRIVFLSTDKVILKKQENFVVEEKNFSEM